jgi:membrane protein required for colicin V production
VTSFGEIYFMSVFDIIFIILFAWAGYKGFSKGLVKTLAGLIALIGGIWGAIKFSEITADFLVKTFEINAKYLHLISFAVTFLGIIIGIHLLAGLLDKIIESVALGMLNKLMGMLFNILKMAFIVSIVLLLVNNVNIKYRFIPEDKTEESVLWEPISALAPKIFPYLQFESVKNSLEFRKIEPEENNDDSLEETKKDV